MDCGWVSSVVFEKLDERLVKSIDETVELATENHERAIRAFRRGIVASGSQANPEELYARLQEISRTEKVLGALVDFKVAANAAGKL